ncbi:hypothetical protein TIFTF001_030336 [Ficus carica]|uniref:Uncharacterized protein n=1 Tax=Ficus carica TaxID=3494 RepID=A0AA88IZG9_FICCA|nr:hypothetical protein TIFTF001_030336 [Ficus carica]
MNPEDSDVPPLVSSLAVLRPTSFRCVGVGKVLVFLAACLGSSRHHCVGQDIWTIQPLPL